jgi:methionyl-tRNA synthetase
VVSKLKLGVEDLSISRLAEKLGGWGVPMPNDPAHTVYVWVDALSNYITATGWPSIGDEWDQKVGDKKFWPADVHLIGKDILWFHAVYWPCILMALGQPLPKCIFAHGWWTSEGRKMSKSLGNFISREVIEKLCVEYGRDAYRYFLLREVPFGADGDFSFENFKNRYNSELANGVGNLLSRTTNMISRYFDGVLPAATAGDMERPVMAAAAELRDLAAGAMEKCDFHQYLEAIFRLVYVTNRYIDDTEPFKLAKDDSQRQRLGTILNTCAQAVRVVLEFLEPFMPDLAGRGLGYLGGPAAVQGNLLERTSWPALAAGTRITKAEPLMPRKQ